jgi:alkylation response protein AidB-like acyl-CoA dehydrogenase
VNFELTDEQELLREAAAEALRRHDTVEAARAGADGAPPLDLWGVAREAGWSGLVVGEDHGGAGLGLFDAMLVLEQCGRRLANAGLLGHLPATLVLQRAAEAGDEIAAGALPALAAGEKRAAIVHAAPPLGGDGWTVDAAGSNGRRAPLPTSSGEGDARTLSGEAGFQPDAPGADLHIVPGVGEAGEVTAHLVEAGAQGLGIEEVWRMDATRPLGHVRLEDTPAAALTAGEDAISEAWCLAQAMLAADALGVSDAVRDMAVEYAKDRHAFGRPIGSYQAIKHTLVDMLRASSTARSLTYYAAISAESMPGELARSTACVRLAAEQAAGFATRSCIAVHGGIGVTWEHDAPYYWRRAQLSRLLLGGESGAADRVADELVAAARAATAAG